MEECEWYSCLENTCKGTPLQSLLCLRQYEKRAPIPDCTPNSRAVSIAQEVQSGPSVNYTNSFTEKHLCYSQMSWKQPQEPRRCGLNQGTQDTMYSTALCWCDRHTKGAKLFHIKPKEASDRPPRPAGTQEDRRPCAVHSSTTQGGF